MQKRNRQSTILSKECRQELGCYFRIFSIMDNRLCINWLITDNRNFNTQSQSGTHHATATRSLGTAPAVVHDAWEKQTAGDAAADAAAASSNSTFTRSTVAVWHWLTERPVSDGRLRRRSRPPGWSDMGGLLPAAPPRKQRVVVSCLVRPPSSPTLITCHGNRQPASKFTEMRLTVKRQRYWPHWKHTPTGRTHSLCKWKMHVHCSHVDTLHDNYYW